MAVGISDAKELLPVAGVTLATAAAGIRYQDRDDMALLLLDERANTAAVFTRNRFCAAPVLVAQRHLAAVRPRALLINSGNANAGTGSAGMQDAEACCSQLAGLLDIDPNQVLPFSTGVIGEVLPMPAIKRGIAELSGHLEADNWLAAARAIMTTDTVSKGVSCQFDMNGETITITGIAKGSGMICPNMATMLSYVATDAAIEQPLLDKLLQRACDASFNRITVDGDTSTNDALVLVASGVVGKTMLERADQPEAELFYQHLEQVLVTLATAIIRDAEGATKFVKVEVQGAHCPADAIAVAYSVAHSPLVKTALFASDPNWGRILAAVGKADVSKLDVERVDIQINGQALLTQGQPSPDYNEALGQQLFGEAEIEITINLNQGAGRHHIWTSDLSQDYVSINADYRS